MIYNRSAEAELINDIISDMEDFYTTEYVHEHINEFGFAYLHFSFINFMKTLYLSS
jgi:hypothetical protein